MRVVVLRLIESGCPEIVYADSDNRANDNACRIDSAAAVAVAVVGDV